MFSRYYRVSFYGMKWFPSEVKEGQFPVKSFIYKKKYKHTIGDIASYLMVTLVNFLHRNNILKNSTKR